jgi:hypothetical protein
MEEKDRPQSRDSQITDREGVAGLKKVEHAGSLSDFDSSAVTLDDEGQRPSEFKPITVPDGNRRVHPDIDHIEAERATPGHELDVELGKVSHLGIIIPDHHLLDFPLTHDRRRTTSQT